MLVPVAIRVLALLAVAVGTASAQPIKASDDIVYPTNPPKQDKPGTSQPKLSDRTPEITPPSSVPSSTSQPREFQIEKIVTLADADGDQTATVTISHLTDKPVSASAIKLLRYFYEQAKDGTITMATSPTSSRWTAPPADWVDKEEDIVLHKDAGPKDGPAYVGVVVGVYYDGQFQDARSEPESLVRDFPVPGSSASLPPLSKSSSAIFLQGYEQLQQADQAIKEKDAAKAKTLLETTISELTELKERRPDWEAPVVAHLLDSLQARLAGLK